DVRERDDGVHRELDDRVEAALRRPEGRDPAPWMLAALALATAISWWVLWLVPGARAPFRIGGDDGVLLAFWLPDLTLLSCVGLVAGLRGRAAGGARLAWLVAGGWAYAALYCLSVSLARGEAWLATILTLPAAALALLAAWSWPRPAPTGGS